MWKWLNNIPPLSKHLLILGWVVVKRGKMTRALTNSTTIPFTFTHHLLSPTLYCNKHFTTHPLHITHLPHFELSYLTLLLLFFFNLTSTSHKLFCSALSECLIGVALYNTKITAFMLVPIYKNSSLVLGAHWLLKLCQTLLSAPVFFVWAYPEFS